MAEEEWLSIAEAAHLLGCTEQVALKLAKADQLGRPLFVPVAGGTAPGDWFVTRTGVEAYLRNRDQE